MKKQLAVLHFDVLSETVDDCLVGVGCSCGRRALRLAVRSSSRGIQMLNLMRPSFAYC
jgi:hypothetical protein